MQSVNLSLLHFTYVRVQNTVNKSKGKCYDTFISVNAYPNITCNSVQNIEL